MSRPLTVRPHLPYEEVERRFRAEDDATVRIHWQIIKLAMEGKPSRFLVEATGFGRDWVFVILKRYNDLGPDGLRDRRSDNGARPMLDGEAQYALGEALQGEPPGGGLWTGPKVAAWMSDRLGRPVHPQRGWDYLKRLGFSLKVPRPRHAKADEAKQEEFKKGASPPPSSGSNERTPTRVWSSGRKTKPASG